MAMMARHREVTTKGMPSRRRRLGKATPPAIPKLVVPHLDADLHLRLAIREHCRLYEHVTQADVRLQNHIESILRRLTGKTKQQRMLGPARGDGPEPPAEQEASSDGPDDPDTQEGPATDDAPETAIPFLEAARIPLQAGKADYGRTIERLVADLPIGAWVRSEPALKGVGLAGVGRIVGACETLLRGNVLSASNPAKVWKRMGLGVTGGRADRRMAGAEGAEMKYSPQRRAIMAVIGTSIIKAQGQGPTPGPLYTLYRTRKDLELGKIQPGAIMGKSKKTGQAVDLRLVIAHKRAMRYIEKRLLRMLWAAWRHTMNPATKETTVSTPGPSSEAGDQQATEKSNSMIRTPAGRQRSSGS